MNTTEHQRLTPTHRAEPFGWEPDRLVLVQWLEKFDLISG